MEKSFNPRKSFTTININTMINFHIRGNSEIFTIDFCKPLFTDLTGNEIMLQTYYVPALRLLYLNGFFKGAGSIFKIGTYVSLFLTICLNPFKSAKYFWFFMGLIQLVYYIPFINCIIPSNFEYFLREYFGVTKLAIPFDSFPKQINPMPYIEMFHDKPFNDQFESMGYRAKSFIYNYLNQILTFITMGFTYLGISLAIYIVPEKL